MSPPLVLSVQVRSATSPRADGRVGDGPGQPAERRLLDRHDPVQDLAGNPEQVATALDQREEDRVRISR